MIDNCKEQLDKTIQKHVDDLYRRAETTGDEADARAYHAFLNLSQEEKIEQIEELRAIEARQEQEKRLERAKILDEIALDAPRFPLDCLPSCLRLYIQEVNAKYHYNETALAFITLTLAGSFAGYKFKLFSRSIGFGEIYPKTGVVCVAPSGVGKTPLYKMLSAPIRDIVNENKRRYQAEVSTFQAKSDALRQAQQELKTLDEKQKRHKKDAAINGDNSRRVAELETTIETLEKELTATQPPAPPALYLVEPKSPEGNKRTILTNLANGHRNGVIISTNEAVKFFSTAGGVEKALDRFAQYSEILDGGDFDEITITTKGAGEFYIPDIKFAGILALIQPRTFSRLLKNEEIKDQGFVNRFVKVYTPYPRNAATIEPLETTAEKSYYKIFQFLARTDGATFDLLPEAVDAFKRWREKNQTRKNAANDVGDIDTVSFLSKAEALCLCFVQTLAICDHVDRLEAAPDDETTIETAIDAATMERAILITDSAIETTLACMRFLLRDRDKEPAPRYCQRLGELEKRLLDVIATAGPNGATLQNMKDKINAFRGGKGSDNDKRLKILLEQLRNAGEITKRGERYALVILNSYGGNDD